jgi:hypothetical protein
MGRADVAGSDFPSADRRPLVIATETMSPRRQGLQSALKLGISLGIHLNWTLLQIGFYPHSETRNPVF